MHIESETQPVTNETLPNAAPTNAHGRTPTRAASRRTPRLVAIALVPTAAAFAFALIALRLAFEPPSVPTYTVTQGAGAQGLAVQRLAAGGTFRVELRPTAPVEGAVGARAFLLRGDHVRPWDPPFSVDRDGTVRIEGPVDTLFAGVPPGAWDATIAVGRPEVLPTAPRDVIRERDRKGGADLSYRIAVVPVWLEGRD